MRVENDVNSPNWNACGRGAWIGVLALVIPLNEASAPSAVPMPAPSSVIASPLADQPQVFVRDAVITGTTPSQLSAGDNLMVTLSVNAQDPASAQAGLPTNRTLWLNALDRHAERVPPAMSERVQSLVATGSSESAVELVVSLLGRDKVVQALVAELIGTRPPNRFHELLAKLPLPAIVDMTWDDEMSRALANVGAAEFASSRHEGIAEALRAASPAYWGGRIAVDPLAVPSSQKGMGGLTC